jgi:peptidoglycan/LPS O-acetylase OafA/YrhL
VTDWIQPSKRAAASARGPSSATALAEPPVRSDAADDDTDPGRRLPARHGARPRIRHLRPLDGLRGVAVLVVVLYHFSPGVAPGGFLGVDVFFVLSGFLITGLLVNEWERVKSISLPSFWARRARRLLPALLLVLAAIGVEAMFVAGHVDAQHISTDGLSAFSYVANWHFIASGQSYIQQFVQTAPSPVRHMWSLAIEEQFYLFWPLVVVAVAALVTFVRRRGQSARLLRMAVLATAVVLGLASFIRMVTLYQPGGDPNRVYYGTDTRAWVLLLGAALGAATAGAPAISGPRLRRAVTIIGSLAGIGLVVAFVTVQASGQLLYEGGYGLLVVAMALALTAAVQPGPNPMRRLLETRALVGLGLISYGVYLWHWPIYVWLTPRSTGVGGVELFALRSAATLGASLLSYYVVEQPIRQGRLPQWRGAPTGVVPMAMVTAVALLLLVPSMAFPAVASAPDVKPTQLSDATTLSYDHAPRCDAIPASQPILNNTTIHVQLVGNSVAQELVPCLTAILRPYGVALTSVTQNGAGLCSLLTTVDAQLQSATRPQVGLLFAVPYDDPPCAPSSSWTAQVSQLLGLWRKAGMRAFLIPFVPAASSQVGGQLTAQGFFDGPRRAQTNNYYEDVGRYPKIADDDPGNIGILDAGRYLRDASGRYQWSLPCASGGEAGCANGTVSVRDPTDGGLHFCADPAFSFTGAPCPVKFAGGERRAAASIAYGLVLSLQALTAKTGAQGLARAAR